MAIEIGDHALEGCENEHAPAADSKRGARCRKAIRPRQVQLQASDKHAAPPALDFREPAVANSHRCRRALSLHLLCFLSSGNA